jgi:ATP adenylyltransferase
MDFLWSPWRYRYVSSGAPKDFCLFCVKAAAPENENADRGNYVVLRGERNFVLLNLFPYTSGHLMIAPYAHVAELDQAEPATLDEMMRLTARTELALRSLYKPDGINIGMNLGACAGAGVAGHIHMHVLPRWCGDASFMTTVAETRVLPEDLAVTWQRLRDALGHIKSG